MRVGNEAQLRTVGDVHIQELHPDLRCHAMAVAGAMRIDAFHLAEAFSFVLGDEGGIVGVVAGCQDHSAIGHETPRLAIDKGFDSDHSARTVAK